jgi:hypothetical protein
MNSTPNRKAMKPTDVLIVRADERRAPPYEWIAPAGFQRVTRVEEEQFVHVTADDVLIARYDEQLARVTDRLSRLEQAAARHPSAAPPHRRSRGWPVLRGLIGLVLAACIFTAAFVSQSSYGDVAKLMIARWAPQLGLTTPLLQKELGRTVQPSSSADQAAAAEPPQPTISAQTAPQEVAPIVAPLSPEVAQMQETRARDLANVEQVIEQLKTSQQQMLRDHAKAFERLKSSQEQMASDQAKAIEQLKMSQEQMASDQAKAIEQLKMSQEQLARGYANIAKQLKESQDQVASFIAKASEPSRRPQTSTPPPRPIPTQTH